MGYHPKHVRHDCKAAGHATLQLPYACAIDHYLDPKVLSTSPYAVRERSFLSNPRTPRAVREGALRVVSACSQPQCAVGVAIGTRNGSTFGADTTIRLDTTVRLPHARPLASVLRAALAPHTRARRLHFDDVLGAFGGFDTTPPYHGLTATYHADAQRLLASWCCTSDPAFASPGRGAVSPATSGRGLVPYLLPPLEGQKAWRGRADMRWLVKRIGV